LHKALAAALSVRAGDLQKQGLSGKEIGTALQQQRIVAIDSALSQG
jgi:hypothetical protein